MKFFQVITFMMFSFLDLHIEARELVAIKATTNVTMQPKNCVTESSVCSVLTPHRKKYELVFGKSTALMDEDTAVLRESAGAVTLLKGRIWVKTGEDIIVRSEFGNAKARNGEFWVTKTDKKILFSTISGELFMQPRGSEELIAVASNYENWLGPVDKSGAATSGIPQLLDIEKHVLRWGKLYSGNKTQFKKDVHEFFVAWYTLIEEASDKNRELALRTIAAEAENTKAQAERQKRIKGEHNRVRDMMLRRLGLDE